MEHDLTTVGGVTRALESPDIKHTEGASYARSLAAIIHGAATQIANQRIAHLGGHLLSTYGVQVIHQDHDAGTEQVVGHLPPLIPENRPIDSLASLGGFILQEYGDGIPGVPDHTPPLTGEGDG